MKKKFIGLLIVILSLTAILPNYIYADDDDDERVNAEAVEQAYGYDNYKQLTEEATTTVSGRDDVSITKRVSSTFSFGAAAAGAIGFIVSVPFMIAHTLISIIASEGTHNFEYFTIEAVVFNEVKLLDSNYVIENNGSKMSKALKSSVLTWYYTVRIIAVAISLLVLIYIGIRMAISTIAEDKAKYKKMIIDWIFSFTLLFLLHYIIVIVLTICEAIVALFGAVGIKTFEKSLLFQIFNIANLVTGWSYVGVVLMYMVMVFYEVKFFLIYLKRLFAIGFLIVISPLITITYSIDRAGDGKAQAFETWIKEFLMFCFTQPIHAGIYVVFINTAYEIFKVAPLLAVLFFASLSRAEKMIRNLLGMKGRASHGGLGDTFKFKYK
ncbi:MAG: hypothetical protein HFJ43_01875 [Clostridia bacterium]|nr:hypothetical protein [Clostridia bacterium]